MPALIPGLRRKRVIDNRPVHFRSATMWGDDFVRRVGCLCLWFLVAILVASCGTSTRNLVAEPGYRIPIGEGLVLASWLSVIDGEALDPYENTTGWPFIKLFWQHEGKTKQTNILFGSYSWESQKPWTTRNARLGIAKTPAGAYSSAQWFEIGKSVSVWGDFFAPFSIKSDRVVYLGRFVFYFSRKLQKWDLQIIDKSEEDIPQFLGIAKTISRDQIDISIPRISF